ncbi:MAG: CoA transferase [Chloroflexi bacterium]|nr:CoA transferase [Chloroflexota bacterium]
MPGPLDGVRVLEVTQIVAGPFCGVNLADLGADVVKIEPPDGDGGRRLGQFVPNESKTFHTLNRGKRSMTLDLKRPEAQALIHRIIPNFDVFLINSRAGVAERLHLDYDSLAQYRPDLVYVESTGFGSSGPSALRSGSDIVAQAYSGLMAGEGKLDPYGAPESISCTAVADYATSLAAAMGICAALYRRATSGEGEFIQTSLLQTALAVQGSNVGQLPVSDELLKRPVLDQIEAIRARGGGYDELIEARKSANVTGKAFRLYYTGYRVQDGALILGALTPGNHAQMRRALGITDDPSADPDFNALDPANDAAIDALGERIRQIMLTKTMDEWLEIFDAEGAPVSKVNLPEDLAHDPQVEAMGYMIELDHEVTGPELLVGPVVQMRHNPTGSPRPSPPLGRHSDEVLSEVGVTADEIAELRAVGAVT